jgi:hypothetical protein
MADAYSSVEFRDVPGFPGYRVGSDGSVWTCWHQVGLGKGKGTRWVLSDHWRQRRSTVTARGYMILPLRKDGRTYHRQVHTLVLVAFAGPRPEGCECRHLDGNRRNNDLANLTWGTHAENETDKVAHGTVARGERVGNAVLNVRKVRKIRRLLAAGWTQMEVARRLGVKRCTVSTVACGRHWRHVK